MGEKMNFKNIILFFIFAFSPLLSIAQISESYRRQNAVVYYDFAETTGDILDKADSKWGAPVNLRIHNPGVVTRSAGQLEIGGAAVIRSLTAATKIHSQCTKSNELTIEILLANNESVQQRSSEVSMQPLRIINYGNTMLRRNFLVGQFYNAGDMYYSAISNTNNLAESMDNSLREPLKNEPSTTLLPTETNPGTKQHVIVTFKRGQARLYLSDQDGRLFALKPQSQDFNGNFASWTSDAFLSLGNDNIDPARMGSILTQNSQFSQCDTPNNQYCNNNPNRYWKGKLFRVAIYCKELTANDIFGAAYKVVEAPLFQIPLGLNITAQHKKALEIFNRITGTKTSLSNPVIDEMVQKLNTNDPVGAAALVTNDPNFYNITLKDFAVQMSNRDETVQAPLNDFAATIIGATRDNLNMKLLLTENITYMADSTKAAVPSNLVNDLLRSNNHYEALTAERYDLSQVLVRTTQKLFDGTRAVDNPSPAGLLTSRQWLAAHSIAGTNRRPVEFAFRQFLCKPLEMVADSSGPDNVVGRDIDRFPGGSHTKYTTTCRACHTIMDGFRPAFSRFTFSNNFVKHSFVVPNLTAANADENTSVGMIQNPPYVAKKYNHNSEVFPGGKEVKDDSWVNNANLGSNKSTFGWTKTEGKGIREFGQLLADSKQYPNCLAEKVFISVCKRAPSSIDKKMLDAAAQEFSSAARNYNLKFLFQKIVTSNECLGGENE